MTNDVEFDYDYLMHKALRGLMQEVLEMVAELGDVPGEHHFFIEFQTTAPGVMIPDHLREDYPERMTIVLQHQFENLVVDDESVSVTLWFKGREARLHVPYEAITSFADPSSQFVLRFEPVEGAADEQAESAPEGDADPSDSSELGEEASEEKNDESNAEGADVVSLDAFRKK